MMWRLRFCCEGADIREEQKIVVEQTEPITTTTTTTRSRVAASVFPAKRKSIKKMACNCVIHCICGKCFKVNKAKAKARAKTVVCSCSPPHPLLAADNYIWKQNKGCTLQGENEISNLPGTN